MRTKIVFSAIFLSIFFLLNIHAQEEKPVVPLAIQADNNANENGICKGETATLRIGLFPWGIREVWNDDLGAFECKSMVTYNPQFTGDGDISQNKAEGVECYTTDFFELIATVTPTKTTTYKLEFTIINTHTGHPDGDEEVVICLEGEITIPVYDPPKPNLLAENTVLTNENINIFIDNCNPPYNLLFKFPCEEIKEEDYNNSNFTCHEGLTLIPSIAPSYTTNLGYQAQFYIHATNKVCKGEIANVNIKVEEEPDPNACNHEDIKYVENRLANGDKSKGDYHYYPVDNVVCNTNTSGCTIEEVWGFLKSDISFQAPTEWEDYDFAGLDIVKERTGLYGENKGKTLSNSNNIANCMEVELPAADNVGFEFVLLTLSGFISLNNGSFALISPNPVKIVIDENAKCITNYTLKGHILYAGKIRRCVVLDECENIKIKTIGTGFHFLGNSIEGREISRKNEKDGTKLFQSVDNRFIEAFNNKF